MALFAGRRRKAGIHPQVKIDALIKSLKSLELGTAS